MMSSRDNFFKKFPAGSFVPFSSLISEDVALKTRKVSLLQNMFGLSKGSYLLVENYCVDEDCDCRKVMINVVDMDKNIILGTIGFGWELPKYYIEWMYGDEKAGKALAGAYIELGGIQNGLENECLELVKNSLHDSNYIELIKGRYKIFKNLIRNLS
ncbi:MAG: hypothetical protein AAB965_02755 [Patescibacteria group bacterium]